MEIRIVDGLPVCIVENVVSPEQCSRFVEQLIADREPFENSPTSEHDNAAEWVRRNITPKSRRFGAELSAKVNKIFAEYLEATRPGDAEDFPEWIFPVAHEWVPGDATGFHTDEAAYGAIFYINDNFQGGETSYLDREMPHSALFTLTPKAGMLVIHPSQLYHGSLPTTEGLRYTMTSFLGTKTQSHRQHKDQ